jgi:hypothetical protein
MNFFAVPLASRRPGKAHALDQQRVKTAEEKDRSFILPTSGFVLAFPVVSQETTPLLFRKARTATGRRLYT